MSILTSLYKIEETNGASGVVPLTTPILKQFSFDLNDISKEDNNNSSILWNFGDPLSGTDNEMVTKSIALSLVEHTYTYPGQYIVHSIANINGVFFHIEQTTTIEVN